MTVESRKRAMEGKLGGKTFRRFQDLKKFKDDNFKHPDFPEEICRGIAVSTKCSSNIEVKWGKLRNADFTYKTMQTKVHSRPWEELWVTF